MVNTKLSTDNVMVNTKLSADNIVVNTKLSTCRVMRLAGDDGNLTKESFIKILKSSDFFMKTFDKNKDGIVTQVTFLKKTLIIS